MDASLDPEVYIALAEQRDWSIGHVLDTHVHADHLSRSRALADKTGAKLHLPNGDQVSFPVELISDGDVLSVGDARLVARATPGHTMGSMTYQLDESALMTGDTLFLEGVGRPDLEASAEETQVRARLLYQSLVKLSTLPDDILILPGHTSAPIEFNGEPIADSLVSVRKNFDLLQLPEEAFVHRISSHIPPAPQNHAAIVALNAAGAEYEGEPADLEAGANRCAFT